MTVFHFDNPIDHGGGFERVSGHDDGDGELSGGAAEEIEDEVAGGGIEVASGFVGE